MKKEQHMLWSWLCFKKKSIQPIRDPIKEGKFALSIKETDISMQRLEKYKPKTGPVLPKLKLPTISREIQLGRKR